MVFFHVAWWSRPLALCEAGRSEFHGAATASWMDATTETSARSFKGVLGGSSNDYLKVKIDGTDTKRWVSQGSL